MMRFQSTFHGLRFFNHKKEVQITISQLLHHTAGIPIETIAKIPQGKDDDILEKTVRVFDNLKLERLPGSRYEYATINYDILGLIINEISNMSFEDYLQTEILTPL